MEGRGSAAWFSREHVNDCAGPRPRKPRPRADADTDTRSRSPRDQRETSAW
ncbi:hypothetical protein BUH_5270 [Burkholderia pseudomallei Pakistan 9]|nr:hypothetical protein BUH_5270 [Burkholderia pseudomallei Pakistan 9]